MTRTDPDFGFELPGYALLREIGRGGVSTVYLARHELLGREVAIKVMSPVLAVEEGFNKRFIREGQTVAQLKHPGIVTVYDVAVADHRPFIAMEYLPGGSLKDRLGEPMEPHEAIAFLRTIADSLGYAHSRGVFHRDVKPENLLFRENGDAVLTDFGIAKSDTNDTQLTSIGVVVGTPRYISPEQAQGHGSDARSDIYALGVILHEMLTGRPPYDVKGSMSLLYAHINEPIPRLPDHLAGYQALLDDLLAKDPDKRIADCAVLLKRLDEPDAPVRGRRGRRASRRAGRRPGSRESRLAKWSVFAASSVLVPAVGLVLWIQGYLPGTGWGPESGRDFRQTVSTLVTTGGEPADARGELVDAGDDPAADTAASTDAGGDADAAGAAPSTRRDGQPLTFFLPEQRPSASGSDPRAEQPSPTPEQQAQQTPASETPPSRGTERTARSEWRMSPAPQQKDVDVEAASDPQNALDAQSIYNQAQALLTGRVKEENLVAAAELHERAAAKGHPLSQYYLGVAYANGDGVPRNESRAVHWLERASQQGVRGAQYNLILARIFGSEPDTGAAAKLALGLADEKYTPVYRILGWMYNTGTGVEASFPQSVRWSVKKMMGDVTGAGGPRWLVSRWERQLEAEVGKIPGPNPPRLKPVLK